MLSNQSAHRPVCLDSGERLAQAAPGREARTDDIRCHLLVDRSPNDTKLGLIDSKGFVSERVLADYKRESRLPVRDALAALVARRVLSVIPGKGYKVALLTKEIIDENRRAGYDSINGIRMELVRTANAAFETISTCAGPEKRKSILDQAEVHVQCAENKLGSNFACFKERGEAVFHATEAIASIGSAAGLWWGADTLRSGLDILEISTRWNRDRNNVEAFEGPEVRDRVKSCRELVKVLTEGGPAQRANVVFSDYLDARVQALSSAISGADGEVAPASDARLVSLAS